MLGQHFLDHGGHVEPFGDHLAIVLQQVVIEQLLDEPAQSLGLSKHRSQGLGVRREGAAGEPQIGAEHRHAEKRLCPAVAYRPVLGW